MEQKWDWVAGKQRARRQAGVPDSGGEYDPRPYRPHAARLATSVEVSSAEGNDPSAVQLAAEPESSEEKRVRESIEAGDYGDALGLSVAELKDNKVIVSAVQQQGERFPRLRSSLNRVQISLIDKKRRALYERAVRIRDNTVRWLESRVGPAILDLPVGDGSSSHPLRTELWRRLENPIRGGGRQEVAREQRRIANEFNRDVIKLAKGFGELQIEVEEARRGEADRWVRKESRPTPLTLWYCSRCSDSGKLSLRWRDILVDPTLEEMLPSKVRQVLLSYLTQPRGVSSIGAREWWRREDLLERIGDESIEVPCPSCNEKITFTIPKGARPGWVVRGVGLSSVNGYDAENAHYARISEITGSKGWFVLKAWITMLVDHVRLAGQVDSGWFILFMCMFIVILVGLVRSILK
jgi:hypothetical protein